jgi:hypothetical protein
VARRDAGGRPCQVQCVRLRSRSPSRSKASLEQSLNEDGRAALSSANIDVAPVTSCVQLLNGSANVIAELGAGVHNARGAIGLVEGCSLANRRGAHPHSRRRRAGGWRLKSDASGAGQALT